MGVKVTITWDGIEEAVSRLGTISERGQQNLVKLTANLADDGKTAWREVTPHRTGRLQGEEEAISSGLSATFRSSTFYYPFVSEGHYTPRGWRTKHGFRPAKRRSHVAGREMTAKLVDWLRQNTPEYLSKFLDGV